ncbi:hypothetical protein A7982_13626 [Minicystis rosea]|nr:hypothetical protein A7982_13626 [Minicystis rosea]
MIDYCPSGVGVPRTRRLLVLDGAAIALDHELDESVQGEEILRATDVDGDGRAEVLMTVLAFRAGRSFTDVSLFQLSPKRRALGRWTAVAHCSPGRTPDDQTTRRIFVRMKGGTPLFRDEAVTEPCFYAPAPPAPP